jgi:L-threonylcarbamoyladenylate synthase
MGTRRRRVSVIYFISKLVKWDDLPMEIISNPTQDEIKQAAQALKDGHLVAFPTETVYGLGADATNERAVSRVYSVKTRPTDHPLIVHISCINQLGKWAIDIPEYAIKLAEEFWPGPMTLILKRSEIAKDFVTGYQNSVGIRVPAHPVAFELLSEFEKLGGSGVAAPSANMFGAISPTNASSVLEEIGGRLEKSDLIIDGGLCEIGIESTILDCTGHVPNILRSGYVLGEQIDQLLGSGSTQSKVSNMRASGHFERHYSPKAQILINQPPGVGDALIALSNIPTPKGSIRICSPADTIEFARQLYSSLRAADNAGIKKIFIYLPKNIGIGTAIVDRIKKASNNPEVY